ncbi:MAG: molybdopterin-dependent oxidoreductase [Candidatus Aminicenantes bacterium]|nr:molybdopterin-dependent oxidoreductase [Candidatus Aminicenantes bacterium]
MKLGLSGLSGIAFHRNSRAKGLSRTSKPYAVSRTSSKRLTAISTTCKQCPAGCGIIAYLDGDRLVQIMGNPDHPNNRGGICAKGIAAINQVNDVERILYPMKRVGIRGNLSWSRITWDEAYFIIQSHIESLSSEGKMEEFVVDMGVKDPLLTLFLSSLGVSNRFCRWIEKNRCSSNALLSVTGVSDLVADVENSRTIFNFGANPFENHDHFIGLSQRMVTARIDKGAQLVTFDVRMSKTAANSDRWIPIKSGTDGLLALALTRIILEKGLCRESLVKNNSRTFFSRLKNHLSQYTLEFTESECGIPAADIEQLADQFASQTPSVAIYGGGVSDHINGYENVRCVALLNLVMGNIGKPGGWIGPELPPELDPFSDIPFDSETASRGVSDLRHFLKSGSPMDTCFIYMSNPAYSDAHCRMTEEILKDERKVPFLVVMDTHMTETAVLADLVLPAATFLESWGLEAGVSLDHKPLINLIQPAVSLLSDAEVLRSPVFNVGKLLDLQFRPCGESKEVGAVCLELARRLGGSFSSSLPFVNTRDFVQKSIAKIAPIFKDGGLEYLKKQGYWECQTQSPERERQPASLKPSPVFAKNKFFSFPEYQPLHSSKKREDNEFILTPFKSNLFSYGSSNSKWSREFFHENRLWINKESARKLGLKNGSKIRVISKRGSLIVKILTTHRIHPDSVAIASGLGHTAVGHIARAKPFRSKDPDTQLVWWTKQGNGVNPNHIIDEQEGNDGFSRGLKDTVVHIEKI